MLQIYKKYIFFTQFLDIKILYINVRDTIDKKGKIIMNTKSYTMGSFEELFEDYTVVSVESYFSAVDREVLRRNHNVVKAMTNYLKSNRTTKKCSAVKIA